MRADRYLIVSCGREPVGGSTERRRSYWYAIPLAASLTMAMVFLAEPTAAQNASTGESYSPSIIINTEVLDSLTPQGPVPGLPFQPSHAGANVITGPSPYGRSGALLFPPKSQPQSRIVGGTGAIVGAPTTAVITSATASTTTGTTVGTSQILTQGDRGTATPAVAPRVPAAQSPTVAVSVPEPTGNTPVAAVQTPTVAVAIPEPSGDPAMPAAPGSAASQPESEQPETAAVVVATPKVPTAETEQTPSQSAAAPSLPATETVAQTTPAVEPAAEAPAPQAPEPQAPEPQAPEPSEALAKETSSDDEPAQNLSEQVLAIVNFEPGSADLNDEGRAQLERVAAAMKSDTSMRVQLQAFAGEDDDSPNASRRLSLSRALVVRGFLLEKDIVSTRMQVRALGDKFGDGPADRVDIRAQGG